MDARIPDQQTLKKQVAIWQEQRNAISSPMKWRFTTDDARLKLKKTLSVILKMTEY